MRRDSILPIVCSITQCRIIWEIYLSCSKSKTLTSYKSNWPATLNNSLALGTCTMARATHQINPIALNSTMKWLYYQLMGTMSSKSISKLIWQKRTQWKQSSSNKFKNILREFRQSRLLSLVTSKARLPQRLSLWIASKESSKSQSSWTTVISGSVPNAKKKGKLPKPPYFTRLAVIFSSRSKGSASASTG